MAEELEPTTAEERKAALRRLAGKENEFVLECRLIAQVDSLETENVRLLNLLRRAALGEEPQIRAYHDPPCGQCLGCQARDALEPTDAL